jgi:hypothetical protein
MKISAWHKQQGDSVEWYIPFTDTYDIVYVSKVFGDSPDYAEVINAKQVVRGGTGYEFSRKEGAENYEAKGQNLPPEIEHIYPDYSLYPTLTKDTAFGFLTRGCPRNCPFCIVGKKEGLTSRKVANLGEFWRGQKNIVLCDTNILACKDWHNLLQQLADSKSWIDFNQGLDIRLMTEEKAKAIASLKVKEVHFAWDRYEDKAKVLPKLQLYSDVAHLKKHGHNAIVYVLTNFDTTIEQDLERIYTLRDMGYWAYVMIYDKAHCAPIYKQMQRWCNNRFIFAKCDKFEDYQM